MCRSQTDPGSKKDRGDSTGKNYDKTLSLKSRDEGLGVHLEFLVVPRPPSRSTTEGLLGSAVQ